MHKNSSKEKTMGLFIKVSEEEKEIIKNLKSKYSINLSSFIRNSLINYYNKLRDINEKQ